MDNVKPITREEKILSGEDLQPRTRMEYFLKEAASGSGLPKITSLDKGKVLSVAGGYDETYVVCPEQTVTLHNGHGQINPPDLSQVEVGDIVRATGSIGQQTMSQDFESRYENGQITLVSVNPDFNAWANSSGEVYYEVLADVPEVDIVFSASISKPIPIQSAWMASNVLVTHVYNDTLDKTAAEILNASLAGPVILIDDDRQDTGRIYQYLLSYVEGNSVVFVRGTSTYNFSFNSISDYPNHVNAQM